MEDITVAKKLVMLNQSANKRGIEFGLSFATVKRLLSRKTCYYTGVPFTEANPRSIDRVDNDKGYVDGNVVACTVAVNQLKSNLTVKQLDMLYKKVHKFID